MNPIPAPASADRRARLSLLIGVFLCSLPFLGSLGFRTQAAEFTQGPSPKTNAPTKTFIDFRTLKGIVLDDTQGEKQGQWVTATSADVPYLGDSFLQDNLTNKVEASIVYTPEIPEAGDYKIVLISPPDENRARNVPVTIVVQGVARLNLLVDQRSKKGFPTLGTFKLPKGRLTSVTVSNTNTVGCVVADGIQFEPVKKTRSRVSKKK